MKCFMSIDAPSCGEQFDDNYLYCQDCDKDHLGNCPIHGPMVRIADAKVEEDDPLRAFESVPTQLSVQESTIPKADLGVLAIKDILRGTVFGPYQGRTVAVDSIEARKSDYCWEIWGPLGPLHCIDGLPIACSNWMRFVNCANSPEQENLKAFQYKAHIFYRTTKDIVIGSELLVYYGPKFAKKLGLNLAKRKSPSGDGDRLSGNVVKELCESSSVDLESDGGHQRGVFKTCMPLMSAPKVEGDVSSPAPKTSRTTLERPQRQLRSSSRRDRVAELATPETVPVVENSDDSLVVHDEFAFNYAVCDVCGLGFSCPPLLLRHVEEIHVQALFIEDCDLCPERFTSAKAKRRHLRKKHGIECSIKGLDGSPQNRKRKRSEANPDDQSRFKCDLCELTYKNSNHLVDHQFLKHGISIVYGCSKCQLKFDYYRHLLDHQKASGHRGHERIRIEQDADQKFLQSLVTREERLRPLKCSVCPKRFQRTCQLRLHESNQHGIIVTYSCRMCRHEFTVFADLMTHHADAKHKGTDRKFVGPDGAEIQRLTPNTLTPVGETGVEPKIKSHSAEKGTGRVANKRKKLSKEGLHQCLRCSYSTRHKTNLVVHHYKVHQIKTMYNCKVCGQPYEDDYQALRKHWRDSGHRGTDRKLVGPDNEVLFEREPTDSHQPLANQALLKDNHDRKKLRNLDPGLHKCSMCDYSTNRKALLMHHQKLKHGIKIMYSCRVCRKPFLKYIQARKHMTETGHKGMARRIEMPSNPPLVKEEPRMRTKLTSLETNISFNHQGRPHGAKSENHSVKRQPNLGQESELVTPLDARVPNFKTRICLNVWKRRREKEQLALYRCFRCHFKSQSPSNLYIHQKSRHGFAVVYSCHVCNLRTSMYQELRKHQTESGHEGTVRKLHRQDVTGPFTKKRLVATSSTNKAEEPGRVPLRRHGSANSISSASAKPPVLTKRARVGGTSVSLAVPLKTYMMRRHDLNSDTTTVIPVRKDPPQVKTGIKRRLHLAEKIYPCSYCNKSFTLPGNRKRHVVAKHPASLAQEVPTLVDLPAELGHEARTSALETSQISSDQSISCHTCRWCDASFESKILLRRHTLTSHDDRTSKVDWSSGKSERSKSRKKSGGREGRENCSWTSGESAGPDIAVAHRPVTSKTKEFQSAFLAFLGVGPADAPEVSTGPKIRLCEESFKDDQLTDHASDKHGGNMCYQCSTCHKMSSSLRGARIHMARTHHHGDIITHLASVCVGSNLPALTSTRCGASLSQIPNTRLRDLDAKDEIMPPITDRLDAQAPSGYKNVTPSCARDTPDTRVQDMDGGGRVGSLASQCSSPGRFVSSLVSEELSGATQEQVPAICPESQWETEMTCQAEVKENDVHLCSLCDRIFTCDSGLKIHLLNDHESLSDHVSISSENGSKNVAVHASRRPPQSQKSVNCRGEPSAEIVVTQFDGTADRQPNTSARPRSKQLSVSSGFKSRSGYSGSHSSNSTPGRRDVVGGPRHCESALGPPQDQDGIKTKTLGVELTSRNGEWDSSAPCAPRDMDRSKMAQENHEGGRRTESIPTPV